jgi:hypothetical protein
MVAWPHGLGRTSWQQEHEAELVLYFLMDRKQKEGDSKGPGTR